MGNPYTGQSASGYNSSPPPDDGTNSSANEITWAKHKTKLTDPLKTFIEAVDSAITSAFAKIFGANTTSTGTNYTVQSSDQGKTIRVTASATITTPTAATEGVPFVFSVRNEHSSAITLDGAGSETIDGSATISLPAGSSVTILTDGTNWFTVGNYGDAGQYNVGSDAGEIAVNEQDWTAIASASTVNIGAAATDRVNITGTTTITAFDTVTAGLTREVRFDGALTLTHNGTSLILPGGANITTASGDVAKFVSEGSGNWRCVKYMKTSGLPVVVARPTLGTEQASTSGTEVDFTGIPSGTRRITITFEAVSLSGTDNFLIQIGDSGGFETTGYVSGSGKIAGTPTSASSTSGFVIGADGAAQALSGTMVLVVSDSTNNTWISSHSMGSSVGYAGGGSKSLSAELDRVRITRSGTDTFDGGAINILYE